MYPGSRQASLPFDMSAPPASSVEDITHAVALSMLDPTLVRALSWEFQGTQLQCSAAAPGDCGSTHSPRLLHVIWTRLIHPICEAEPEWFRDVLENRILSDDDARILRWDSLSRLDLHGHVFSRPHVLGPALRVVHVALSLLGKPGDGYVLPVLHGKVVVIQRFELEVL